MMRKQLTVCKRESVFWAEGYDSGLLFSDFSACTSQQYFAGHPDLYDKICSPDLIKYSSLSDWRKVTNRAFSILSNDHHERDETKNCSGKILFLAGNFADFKFLKLPDFRKLFFLKSLNLISEILRVNQIVKYGCPLAGRSPP